MSGRGLTIGDEGGAVVAYDERSIMEMISEAANNPAIDVGKLNALLDLRDRVRRDVAEAAFFDALERMHPELPVIPKTGKIINNKGVVQSTFAEFDHIQEAVEPILKKHGFRLIFRTQPMTDKGTPVTTILRHVGGHKEETTLTMPLDTTGAKNNVQGVGSSLSYGKRYGTVAILNIRTIGEDDDGRGGRQDIEYITEKQAGDLEALLTECSPGKGNRESFLKLAGAENFSKIRADDYKRVLDALMTVRTRKGFR